MLSIKFLIKSGNCSFFQSIICKYIAKVQIFDYEENYSNRNYRSTNLSCNENVVQILSLVHIIILCVTQKYSLIALFFSKISYIGKTCLEYRKCILHILKHNQNISNKICIYCILNGFLSS